MVLVDTSVWIRFLANRLPHASELERLLELNEAAGHELVYGELLIGDAGRRSRLVDTFRLIHQVPSVRHHEVVDFVRSHRLHGIGIGWIDAHLLASARANSVRLWTADQRLAEAAEAVGVLYRIGP